MWRPTDKEWDDLVTELRGQTGVPRASIEHVLKALQNRDWYPPSPVEDTAKLRVLQQKRAEASLKGDRERTEDFDAEIRELFDE